MRILKAVPTQNVKLKVKTRLSSVVIEETRGVLKYARSRVWPCESRCCVVAARDVAVVILLFPV